MTTNNNKELTGRQLAIVLASLRYAQSNIKDVDFEFWINSDEEVTDGEIDELCENINYG